MHYQKKIGFVGLGEMGRPMASNLIKKGFHVAVFDAKKELMSDLVANGATAADSLREIGKNSDIIITMVRDSAQTDEVLFGQNGVMQEIRKNSVIIISSTLAPQYCQNVEQKVKEKDVSVLDAPVSGASAGAIAGTLSFMVGGEKAIFDLCYPIFEAMGKNIFYMGSVGAGESMKLVNNTITICSTAVASEAISAGLNAGMDLTRMLEVIKVSSGASFIIDNWDFLGKVIRDRPGQIQIGYKDLSLGIKFGNDVGKLMPIAALISQMDGSEWLPDKP